MIYFIYGDDQVKINNYILDFSKKNNLQKNYHELQADNSSEVLGSIETPSLFGDKNLFIIDITDTEFETLEPMIPRISDSSEVILLYRGEIDKRSKEFKLLSKLKTINYSQVKSNAVFTFVDTLFLGDPKKTYQEYENLMKNKEEELAIFNLIVSTLRSLSYFKFDSKLKTKVPPFKKSFFEILAKKYTEEDISNIYNVLAQNDLKFKNGELTSDMLLVHTINTILNHANNK